MDELYKALIASGGAGLLAAGETLLIGGLLLYVRGLQAQVQTLTTTAVQALTANTEVNRQTNDNRLLLTDTVKELGHSMAMNQAKTESVLANVLAIAERIEDRP